MRSALLLLISVLFGSATFAIEIPAKPEHSIVDFAEVLSPETFDALSDLVTRFETDHGFEMVVVTMSHPKDWNWSGTLENLAGRVRREWDVVGAPLDNGLLVLVSTELAESAISTGGGYSTRFRKTADQVFDEAAQSGLSKGRFDVAIPKGIRAIIARETPPKFVHLSGLLAFSLIAILCFAIGIRVFWDKVERWTLRFRRCPYCTRKSLQMDQLSYEDEDGSAKRVNLKTRIFCEWCGYRKDDRTVMRLPLSKISKI